MQDMSGIFFFLSGVIFFTTLSTLLSMVILHRDFTELRCSIDRLISFMERQQAKGL